MDAESFSRLKLKVQHHADRLAKEEGAILQVNPDRYEVRKLGGWSRTVVRRRLRDGLWYCEQDHNTEEAPCAHVLALMLHLRDAERPTRGTAWHKSDVPRNHRLEERRAEAVPVEVPRLLARLLEEALPVIAPEPEPDPRGGRPRASRFQLIYQSVIRVAWRMSLRGIRGAMRLPHHAVHYPDGGLSRSVVSRFLKDEETTTILEKLLAVTTCPVAPYDFIIHLDATGLTEERFSAYFDEKRVKELRDSARRAASQGIKTPPVRRREHEWNYASMIWTYRYNLIAAIYSQRGGFGEAPWSVPLLRRVALTMDVQEFGADAAYNAIYLDTYLDQRGIESQIIPKDNAAISGPGSAFRERIRWAHLDPEGFGARAYRRENAESGNHAYKSFLGDQLYSKPSKKDPKGRAQRNEILCEALAYNLTRLVQFGLERDLEVHFAEGARRVRDAKWASLEELMASSYVGSASNRKLSPSLLSPISTRVPKGGEAMSAA